MSVPRKAGRAPLTRDEILATALRLVDEHGIDALSMRRLAAELRVDPMAIYRHVPGKQALIEGLVTIVFGEMQPAGGTTSPTSPWQERVRQWARAYRELARTHPNLVLHLVTNPAAATLARLEAEETLFAALADAGLAPDSIVLAAGALVDYLNGVALAESTGLTESGGDELVTHLQQRPEGELPTMRRVYAALAAGDRAVDFFDFGLDLIVGGLIALAEHKQ